MAKGGPTWYSVMVDVHDGGQWGPGEAPFTEAWDGVPDPSAVARQIAERYGLEPGGIWQVRVYAGYNRYENLLTALTGEDRDEDAAAS